MERVLSDETVEGVNMKIVIPNLPKDSLEQRNESKLEEFEFSFLEALRLRQKALDPRVFKAGPVKEEK